MIVRSLARFAKLLLTVPTDDIELVRAQFKAFSKQIPLLYFILATNTAAVMLTYVHLGPVWLSLYAPGALCVICLLRGVKWWRIGRSPVADADAIRHMRMTNKLAFAMAVAFSVWGMSLFPYGDAYAKGQIVFFLALTMISCIFCLMHLRSAALTVCLVGIVPFSVYFFFGDGGHFRAASVNLALVGVGMIAILTVYYRDFANLVASRRALIDKQAETQRLSDENLRLANIDSLSGLSNRRALMSKLNEMQHAERRGDDPTAVVFIDLDGFKDVNDTYGHETGDQLIMRVAENLQEMLPARAMLARLGGDEFAVLLSSPRAAEEAQAFATAFVELLRQPVRIRERTIQVGASVGISCAGPDGCSAQELFRRADTALYYVKANGKSGVKLYSADLDRERQRAQELEEQIRRGLAGGEFEVYYQPIVDAESQRVVSLEALLRWPRRPEGQIGPDKFISVAESSGLIHPLGLFALRRACEELAAFPALRLNVNISPAQFRDPAFETKVGEVLNETGFPAARLELELTEGYLIDHPQRAAMAISSLKGMGIGVALDDFGTGYTSIAYLQEYGFSQIKIDKSLVARVGRDKKAGVLIAGSVYLANGLDMEVTAEGVETPEQEQLLRASGCRYLQGYLFCEPLPMRLLILRELDGLRDMDVKVPLALGSSAA